MPAITEFTTELTREKEWDNIAAIHSGLSMVTSWSFDKCKMGELKLKPPPTSDGVEPAYLEATCITLTNCGNFVVVGYSNGQVERFNLQSGIHRASYGPPRAHKTAIRGVVCDALNQVVCSASSNGWIKFWHFNSKRELLVIYLVSSLLLIGVISSFCRIHCTNPPGETLRRHCAGAESSREWNGGDRL